MNLPVTIFLLNITSDAYPVETRPVTASVVSDIKLYKPVGVEKFGSLVVEATIEAASAAVKTKEENKLPVVVLVNFS